MALPLETNMRGVVFSALLDIYIYVFKHWESFDLHDDIWSLIAVCGDLFSWFSLKGRVLFWRNVCTVDFTFIINGEWRTNTNPHEDQRTPHVHAPSDGLVDMQQQMSEGFSFLWCKQVCATVGGVEVKFTDVIFLVNLYNSSSYL